MQTDSNTQINSFYKIVWEQFREHKAAFVGLIVVTTFALVGILAPLIALLTGLNPEVQNPLKRYLAPMTYSELSSTEKDEFIDRFIAKDPKLTGSLQEALASVEPETFFPAEDALYIWIQFPADEALALAQETPFASELKKILSGVRTFHFLGTDELGRDVFIRLVYGTRVSLGVGILVALSSALIGLLIGSLAGFYGGWVDHTLMRVTDALLSLPLMPVLIVVSALSFEKIPGIGSFFVGGKESIFKLVLILVLFSWMSVARLVRAEVLSLREREFILAARTLGATDRLILFKHLFPNVIAPLLVSVTLGIGESIQFEAALSFLGLGIQQPTPSWGNMLFNAQELITEAPFLAMIPGVLILLITICFNYMGDGLQEAVNPKSIKR